MFLVHASESEPPENNGQHLPLFKRRLMHVRLSNTLSLNVTLSL